MIESLQNPLIVQDRPAHAARARVFSQKNERTAGSMPVWGQEKTVRQEITARLSSVSEAASSNALSYAPSEQKLPVSEKPFGFWDLVDMVNPLQHIPVVSHLYRSLTGDEIKPAGKIIGGTLYGGMAGAAASITNAIIEEETGRDITGNAMAFIFDGEKPHFKEKSPETRLAEASSNEDILMDLPGNVLSFVDLGEGKRMVYEKVAAANGRTAGFITRNFVQTA